jgi:hypothetical protein
VDQTNNPEEKIFSHPQPKTADVKMRKADEGYVRIARKEQTTKEACTKSICRN